MNQKEHRDLFAQTQKQCQSCTESALLAMIKQEKEKSAAAVLRICTATYNLWQPPHKKAINLKAEGLCWTDKDVINIGTGKLHPAVALAFTSSENIRNLLARIPIPDQLAFLKPGGVPVVVDGVKGQTEVQGMSVADMEYRHVKRAIDPIKGRMRTLDEQRHDLILFPDANKKRKDAEAAARQPIKNDQIEVDKKTSQASFKGAGTIGKKGLSSLLEDIAPQAGPINMRSKKKKAGRQLDLSGYPDSAWENLLLQAKSKGVDVEGLLFYAADLMGFTEKPETAAKKTA